MTEHIPKYKCILCNLNFTNIPDIKNNECGRGYQHKIVNTKKLLKLIEKRERVEDKR